MASINVSCPKCNHQFAHEQVETPKGTKAPGEGTKTGQVWDLCRSLSTQLGRRATRKEVVDAGTQKGMNLATIVTQYQRWLTAEGKALAVSTTPVAPPQAAGTQAEQVAPVQASA